MRESSSLDEDKSKPTYQEITLDTFIATFPEIETGVLYRLSSEVTLEDFKKLAYLPVEVAVLADFDGNCYIVKGRESEEESAVTIRTVFKNLNIVKLSHTQIKSSDDSPGNRLFLESLPSAADLASRGLGLVQGYIYSQFGRTTYTTYDVEGMGRLPHGTDEYGSTNMVERQISLMMFRDAATAAKPHNFSNPEELLNFIGIYMEDKMGCGFRFEKWEDIL